MLKINSNHVELHSYSPEYIKLTFLNKTTNIPRTVAKIDNLKQNPAVHNWNVANSIYVTVSSRPTFSCISCIEKWVKMWNGRNFVVRAGVVMQLMFVKISIISTLFALTKTECYFHFMFIVNISLNNSVDLLQRCPVFADTKAYLNIITLHSLFKFYVFGPLVKIIEK